jgi:hypothetical protein
VRLFVHYTKDGQIVSTTKATVLPEGLEHPYVDVGEDDAVLEVEPSAELERLAAHEIAEQYSVDVGAKQLKPRSAARSPRRSRQRRSDT